WVSSISASHFWWLPTGSTLIPITLQLRLSNSGLRLARYPSSVVHTGVKSLGWENRIAQPLPIHSWKLIFPWVVSAVKFGASLLMRKAIVYSSINESVVETPCARQHASGRRRRPGVSLWQHSLEGGRQRFVIARSTRGSRHDDDLADHLP